MNQLNTITYYLPLMARYARRIVLNEEAAKDIAAECIKFCLEKHPADDSDLRSMIKYRLRNDYFEWLKCNTRFCLES